MNIRNLLYFFLFFVSLPFVAAAQAPADYLRAEVSSIVETTYPVVFGSEIEFQRLEVVFDDGTLSDVIFNDYTPVAVGDIVYVVQGYDVESETEGYFVREINRTSSLFWIFGIFVLVYLAIAGMKGFRSLLALGISIAAVWFVLIPLIIAGHSPVLVGFGVSVVILGIAIFVTHGMTIVSLASYIGSLLAIVITIYFAHLAVSWARISGLVGDHGTTIAVLYGSSIDLQGLVLAAMIIGILGVLDDVAVMQAAMVREFMYAKTFSLKEVFTKSMRVGREHAAALVNTLVLAYTAVALPLFLVILSPVNNYSGETLPLSIQLSNELFVVEFIRSIVGSLGLVITIPIVTFLAILLFKKFPPKTPGNTHHHH